ncbi:hypothetical protein C1N91_12250 [Curtobacterium sp. SGAir0471]|uniref:phosphatase domain-containing protein n=1 Tax=Curtobacterium sp. SGAir0471 TaxID=2070337 RepID=UPI0010CD1568|nr:phosphatase domain-containing protein [Curtobacterium sp. SGAir0471]QCR44178.1 hypothetical protein C1N91_12250 [Curtobacterium sp. SGAir0471]
MAPLLRVPRSVRQGAVSIAYGAETTLRRALSAVAERVGWRPALLPYSGYASPEGARVLARVVLAPAGVDPAARRGIAAWRRLLTLECPDTEVRVEFAGTTTVVASDPAGLVDVTVPVHAALGDGPVDARLSVGRRVAVRVPVHVVTGGHGVVCDIDDTVWVTGIGHPLQAARRTLFGTSSTREAVPGMAALVREAARSQRGAAVVYLSNGPWNFAGVVTRFLRKKGFPAGAVLMTDWGVEPTRWFRDGQAHKRSSLVRLHEDLPEVSWVLVGDDGEHDPELYEAFARAHPASVDAIALRQVAPDAPVVDDATDVAGVPVVRGRDGHALLPLLRAALGERRSP